MYHEGVCVRRGQEPNASLSTMSDLQYERGGYADRATANDDSLLSSRLLEGITGAADEQQEGDG